MVSFLFSKIAVIITTVIPITMSTLMTTVNTIIVPSLSLAACKEVDTTLPLESQE